jgi:hypothetical protein
LTSAEYTIRGTAMVDSTWQQNKTKKKNILSPSMEYFGKQRD